MVRWDKAALQAAAMSVAVCCPRTKEGSALVGVDLHARDGRVFAHGHLEIEDAERLWKDLGAAIVEARAT